MAKSALQNLNRFVCKVSDAPHSPRSAISWVNVPQTWWPVLKKYVWFWQTSNFFTNK